MFSQISWHFFNIISMASRSIVFVDRIKIAPALRSTNRHLWSFEIGKHCSDRWNHHIWSWNPLCNHNQCVLTHPLLWHAHHECNHPSQDVHVWVQTHWNMQHTAIAHKRLWPRQATCMPTSVSNATHPWPANTHAHAHTCNVLIAIASVMQLSTLKYADLRDADAKFNGLEMLICRSQDQQIHCLQL